MKIKKPLAACLFLLVINWPMLFGQANPADIQLNQAGFYPFGPKLAVLTKRLSTAQFYVVRTNTADTVFRGVLSLRVQSKNSSLITQTADFSNFTRPGSYFIAIPGAVSSYPFNVSNNIHRATGIAAIKGYYFQRVSMPLEQKYAGKWSRPAGHPDTTVLVHASAASANRVAGTVISSPGGWYDAGDYNKYIVNSGITMGTLLSAYEDFTSYFDSINTTIPESGNDVPDLIDEIIYNLRWMLTMQDPFDGGVYNKCTNAIFDGMVMPGVTKAPRYLVQKGTAATLDFAAVMAQSNRILKKFTAQYPALADSCLAAALKAWRWCQVNPSMRYDQGEINKNFLPQITTGPYGDKYFTDELFWAAAELYVSTGDLQFLPFVKQGIIAPLRLPNWAEVHLPGVYTLLRLKNKLPANDQPMVAEAGDRLIAFAMQLTWQIEQHAFKTVMGQSPADFNWGSNSNAANQAIVLINAYLLTKNKVFIDQALTNLDYLLGRNATGYCFVTSIGTRPPMHPHHRASVADSIAEPVPGLLVAGPNPGRQDKCKYPFAEPELAYVDDDCAYASNEIAINWNGPLVYLANALEALQFDTGYAK